MTVSKGVGRKIFGRGRGNGKKTEK